MSNLMSLTSAIYVAGACAASADRLTAAVVGGTQRRRVGCRARHPPTGGSTVRRQACTAAGYPGALSRKSGILSLPLLSGLGKSAMPWLRMQRENLSACALACCCWVAETVGDGDLQALCAAWS